MTRLSIATMTVAIATLAIIVGSCSAPRVVTAVTPYVAVLPQDTANHALGSSGCDLNGQPVIYINPRLKAPYVPWVLLHEQVHVQQSLAHKDGCPGYVHEYLASESFRLHAEAEAFCGVYRAQLDAGVDPMPDLDGIVYLLTLHSDRGYRGTWTEEQTRAAMSCWKDHPSP